MAEPRPTIWREIQIAGGGEMSLLDKAVLAPAYRRTSLPPEHELLELAVAWVRGTISSSQLLFALDKKPGKHNVSSLTYNTVAPILRAAHRSGQIDVVVK